MNREKIEDILNRVERGVLSSASALELLRDLPYSDLGFARLDHHRELRTGIPEIVWGENKTISQISSIIRRMTDKSSLVLASRIDAGKGEALLREFPSGVYHAQARLFSKS